MSGGLGEREMLCFHSFFPNFHECFYNSIETRRKCFLFPLENSPRKITKNEENLIVLFIIKTEILYTTQFTRHKPDQPINSTHVNAVTLARDYDNFYRVLVEFH